MFRIVSIILLLVLFLAGCTDGDYYKGNLAVPNIPAEISKTDSGFENLDIPAEYDLRRFEGMTLNFIVENNLYATILSHESEAFSTVTGINVKVRAMDFDTLAKKESLDFISKAGKYQIVYVDPYRTLSRFHDDLEVLNPYNANKNSPHIKGLVDDFFEDQTMVCSYFGNKENLYAVPFDSATMILYYRKDIFEKYKDAFYKEKGYDWTPGTPEFTWERYCEVAHWIDQNVPNVEVAYGAGHMAQQHNSIFCDFSNVLASYGGDYFSDSGMSTLGVENYQTISIDSSEALKALDMYKRILSVSAPESINWNWTDSANAFRNGEIAMMPNWDENYTYMEHDAESAVKGKVGYAILPKGDVRSANIYGGSGIGINKYASEQEKQAAWLYIVWATSSEMQLKVLKHPEGGSLPTRKSVCEALEGPALVEEPESIENAGAFDDHIVAVLQAWQRENVYLRPKVSHFYEAEQVLNRNLHEMVKFNRDSKVVSQKIYDELSRIKSNQ